jgi:hypothetical protein
MRTIPIVLTEKAIKRFWRYVDIPDDTEDSVAVSCWLWKGSRYSKGRKKKLDGSFRDRLVYGGFYHCYYKYSAHRVAWVIHHGKQISDGMCVCHTCDNPFCVNPKHLFLGTRGDNNRDMAAKGRLHIAHGTKNNQAKVSEKDVTAIRAEKAAGIPAKVIAARRNIGWSQVYNIVSGRSWKHTYQRDMDLIAQGIPPEALGKPVDPSEFPIPWYAWDDLGRG